MRKKKRQQLKILHVFIFLNVSVRIFKAINKIWVKHSFSRNFACFFLYSLCFSILKNLKIHITQNDRFIYKCFSYNFFCFYDIFILVFFCSWRRHTIRVEKANVLAKSNSFSLDSLSLFISFWFNECNRN